MSCFYAHSLLLHDKFLRHVMSKYHGRRSGSGCLGRSRFPKKGRIRILRSVWSRIFLKVGSGSFLTNGIGSGLNPSGSATLPKTNSRTLNHYCTFTLFLPLHLLFHCFLTILTMEKKRRNIKQEDTFNNVIFSSYAFSQDPD